MALQDPPARDIFDVAVNAAGNLLGLSFAAVGEVAGRAPGILADITGHLAEATTPSGDFFGAASTKKVSPSPDFAALIKDCGSLNLGLKAEIGQAETGRDVCISNTGQMSAATFFGAGYKSGCEIGA